MNQIFMLDLETTGTNPKTDDVLQIAILELTRPSVRDFWAPGRLYSRLLGSIKQPQDAFAREHLSALYARCNLLLPPQPEVIRAEIKAFLTERGAPNLAIAAGHNAAGFDLPFLYEHGYARPPEHDPVTNVPTGDFHYRVYELSGAISLAQDLLGEPNRRDLEARALAAYPEIQLPEGGQAHDAVYDCYAQARKLNGLIRLCRGGAA